MIAIVRKRLRRRARRLWNRYVPAIARRVALRRHQRPRAGKAHGLPGELIVSLTSYPARFPTLHLTLACLLDQTVKADRTILWIAHGDLDRLPPEVRKLKQRGLDIRGCDDIRSFKKLVPALEAFPDAFIVTADDDLYYPADWLEQLVEGALRHETIIQCHRTHRIKRSCDGKMAPYLAWDSDVQDERARRPSSDLLATTGAGALFPPNSLHPRVTDRDLFQRLCPDGDDLWFYWCAREAGTKHRKIGRRFRLTFWKGTQDSRLWNQNEQGGNDKMIAALQAEFGKLDA